MSSALGAKRSCGGVGAMSRSTGPCARPSRGARHQPSHVALALTKERKTEVVTKLKSELETSTAVVGFTFKGVSVADLEKLRGDIPDDASLVVAKNTLMKRAADEVEGWGEVSQFCKGSNAFLFLREDLKTGFKVSEQTDALFFSFANAVVLVLFLCVCVCVLTLFCPYLATTAGPEDPRRRVQEGR